MKKNIVILTGAGISAESGIATFRDSGGLWNNFKVEDVATPEGFQRNPSLVHKFYNHRRAELKNVKPNAAHYALAELEEKYDGDVLIITQNVDDLHERAGTKNLIHMHGELKKIKCTRCNSVFVIEGDCELSSECPSCGSQSTLRPDIVWFGEIPYGLDGISSKLYNCDLFISVGTSGAVYPAAGFVQNVSLSAHTVELNIEKSQGASLFKEKHYGKASDLVPQYVAKLLS